MGQWLIKLEEIVKTYHLGEMDVPVLRGVSALIERGDLLALMGPSGSGKTTLMNLLGCLDRPTSGRYWLDGHEVSTLSSDQLAMLRNQKIGFVFQSFNLLSRTSALENVMMPLFYGPVDVNEKQARERAEYLLELVGLDDRMDHQPSQLSGGQQQRVAIARSLVNNPPMLLADEPTGNLDSKSSEEILAIFERLNADHNITIILVTHDPGISRHTKRVIYLRDGMVVDASEVPELSLAARKIGHATGA